MSNQKIQQDIYNELARSNKDKANKAMLTAIETYDGVERSKFEEWINGLNQACWVSRCDFYMEIIKKSIGAVQKIVLTSGDSLDDQLLSNHSCFSDAPTMNQAREDLRNMRHWERESVMVYAYRWGRALVRSSGICHKDERHPHIIKDFISSLKHNIRNKITNKWADFKNPPHTVQQAFDLVIKMEPQIQVADSFKIELNSNLTSMDINEISADEPSSDEFEVNKVSIGKRWNNNKHKKRGYNTN